jgi:hypothetical protein
MQKGDLFMNEKDSLLEDIQKSGFPLEYRVAHKFMDHQYNVIPSLYYIDKDEHKGREIDLVANSTLHELDKDGGKNIEYDSSLIVEIKKSVKHPWIFFMYPRDGFKETRNIALNQIASSENYGLSGALLNNFGLHSEVGKSFSTGFIGDRENGQQRGRDDIYKALSGSVKALWHFKESNNLDILSSDNILVNSYDSLVIMEGSLYKASVDEANKIILTNTNYIQVAFNYLSPNYPLKNRLNRNNYSFVRVITYDYLDEFLENYKKEQEDFFNRLKKQANYFGKTTFPIDEE